MLRSLIVLLLFLLSACGGSDHPVPVAGHPPAYRGVNLFYLAEGTQDMPYILRTIDEPQTRADLDRILTALQAANVNTIRLLVAADHFPLVERRDGLPITTTWPAPAAWQTEGLRKLVDIIAAKQMGVYLIFVGKTVEEKNGTFISAHDDLFWINAFLSKVNRSAIVHVDLSGDIFICDNDGCERNDYQKGHADYIKQLWAGRPRTWPVGYEAGGPNDLTSPEGVKHSIRWMQTNTPGAPISIGFYGEAKDVPAFVAAIDSFKVPIWISEFGGTPEFYQAFLAAACERKWAMFAWTGGVGWYGYGLWHPTLNDPTPQLAILSEFYTTKCSR